MYSTTASQDKLKKILPKNTRPDTPRPDTSSLEEVKFYSLGHGLFSFAEKNPLHPKITSIIRESKSLDFIEDRHCSKEELRVFLMENKCKTASPSTITTGSSPHIGDSSEIDDFVCNETQGITI